MNKGKIFSAAFLSLILTFVSLILLSIIFPSCGFYRGEPVTVWKFIEWILLTEEVNIAFLIVAIALSYLVMGTWIRDLKAAILYPLLSFLMICAYLVYKEKVYVLFSSNPFPFITTSLIFSLIGAFIEEKRPKKTFFQKLEEGGVRIDPAYVKKVSLPIECPRCGVKIYSNARYCWRCLADLYHLIYAKNNKL